MPNEGKHLDIPKTETRAISVVDPLQHYMQEMKSYPLVGADEEKELARRYHDEGDIEAAKKLVAAHLRLVVKIAMEYRSAYHNVLDLIQEGNVGLMQAVKNFDPEKGARLGHYATWWIKSYILKYILDNFRLIKLGTTKNQKKMFYNLMREKEKIEAMGYYATPVELSKRLNVPADQVEEMQKRLTTPELALEAPAGRKSGEGTAILQDFLPLEQTPVDEQMVKDQTQDILTDKFAEFAGTLGDRDKKIFHERLLAELPRTLQDIADEYGISKERVRQIEARMIEKLKVFFSESGVEVDTLDF